MKLRKIWIAVLTAALAASLTACRNGGMGIIGGADGPTVVIVDGGMSKIEPEAPEKSEDAGAVAENADPENADAGILAENADPETVAEDVAPENADPESLAENSDDAATVPDDTPTPLTLALLSGPWAAAVRDALPVFEDEHHVTCDVTELSRDELRDALASGGSGFDVMMVHSSGAADYKKSGVLANLSALGFKSDDDFIPSVAEICMDGSAYLAAPWHANSTVLLCNKENLISIGYSTDRLKSLENLLAACKAAKKQGKLGFVYHQSNDERFEMDFLPILRSFDGWVVDRDNNPTIYTKKFQDAMNFFLELAATGKAVSNSEFRAAIYDGQAAMGFIHTDAYKPSATSKATYITFPGALTPNGDPHKTGVISSWSLGIPAESQHPELAESLVEYLTHPNIEKALLPAGVVPCRYSILNDPEIRKAYPHFAKISAALDNSQYAPELAQWPQMRGILGEELWKVMAGRKKVTEALADGQSRLTALLAS